MSIASKLIGLQEDFSQTLDAMKRRVHQRAISKGEDPDAAWRSAEPTYRSMLNEPAQQQSMVAKEQAQGQAVQGRASGGQFNSIYDAAEAAMRSASEGPARDKLQQIMVLAQELMQTSESTLQRKPKLIESVLGI